MTPHLSVQTANPVFETFLFAAIGEEANGMMLSVLSGLSRLNLDPWEEAARLSQLPKRGAAESLGRCIARLPRGAWQVSDVASIAVRLVELLPRHQPGGTQPVSEPRPVIRSKPVLWLIAAILAAVLMFGLPARVERLLSGDSGTNAPVHAPSTRP
jgi:hypothetical protein